MASHDHTGNGAQWHTTRTQEEGAAAVTSLFEASYHYAPEGVWAAPGRVNLIGEHVDYAGGICLPFALTQYAYVAVSRNNDGVYRAIDDLAQGEIFEIPVSEVGPGNPSNWTGYVLGAIWAAENAGLLAPSSSDSSEPPNAPMQGFDVALVSDVPIGAGLSSSAAIECSAAVAAVEITHGRDINEVERVALVDAAMRAENEVVGAATGGMDQKISLLGWEGDALAIDFGTGAYRQVPFNIAEHGLAILVANTNSPHSLADGQYASRRGVIDAVAALAGKSTLRMVTNPYETASTWARENTPEGMDPQEWAETVHRRVRHVISEIARTEKAIAQLEAGDFKAFGESMQLSHISLRHDYEVSTPELDTVVEIALAHGALGARMTGGGFGGSAIALIPADRLEECADAIAEAFHQRGYPVPEFIAATPSLGAHRVK